MEDELKEIERKEKAAETAREFYNKNRERLLLRRKLNKKPLTEAEKEYAKKYYQENKEKIRENYNRWLLDNRDKWNEYQKEYAKNKRG